MCSEQDCTSSAGARSQLGGAPGHAIPPGLSGGQGDLCLAKVAVLAVAALELVSPITVAHALVTSRLHYCNMFYVDLLLKVAQKLKPILKVACVVGWGSTVWLG